VDASDRVSRLKQSTWMSETENVERERVTMRKENERDKNGVCVSLILLEKRRVCFESGAS
jgi:hypothetical protein